MVTFALTEFEIKQAASDLCNIFSAFSLKLSSAITTVGFKCTSVINSFPSTVSKTPLASQEKDLNSNFENSAIDKNVVIKQELIAAV